MIDSGPRPAGSADLPYLPDTSDGHPGPSGTAGPADGEHRWIRPQSGPRRRATDASDDVAQDEWPEDRKYGQLLGYTAGWYGIPALFYLIWLVTLDGERQSLVGRQFVASLPWLLAAIVLSLTVAALLRWAIIGWRTLTLSFAAAVIGAGVTTIAHSLSF
ncbi:MAG TPA: hypothetical protein VF163_14450 [Micromonosporaceae bacterium]